MYTDRNFKTKKALKEAVAAWVQWQDLKALPALTVGSVLASKVANPPRAVTYYQPNDMGFEPLKRDGTIFIEGPHYPEPHKWYAQCEAKDGVIVKVK